MLERFWSHLVRLGLDSKETTTLVGYSGGADSTCLLSMLHRLQVPVAAAHLHHGQRQEADNELEQCRATCERWGIPFFAGRSDVVQLASDMRIGIEEAGRRARYAFFDQAAVASGCALIATAHTQDDLVETVLLNLTRGCGTHGLGGIPERRGNIVRPLLPFTRSETRGYCSAEGLWFHDDPTNDDVRFSRARIRHRVIPDLLALNPGMGSAVARLAQLAGDEDRYLDGLAAMAMSSVEIRLNGPWRFITADCEFALDRKQLSAMQAVLVRRALRIGVAALGATLNFDQVQHLLDGLVREERGSVTADEGQVVVEWSAERVDFRQLAPDSWLPFPPTVPGCTTNSVFGWSIVGEAVEPPSDFANSARLEGWIDSDSIQGRLVARTAEADDHVLAVGTGREKSVRELLRSVHLSSAARSRFPLVADEAGPIWAAGIFVADRAKVHPGTRRAWRLSLQPQHTDNDIMVGTVEPGGT